MNKRMKKLEDELKSFKRIIMEDKRDTILNVESHIRKMIIFPIKNIFHWMTMNF